MSKNEILFIAALTIMLFVSNTNSSSSFLKKTLNINLKSNSLLELEATEIQKEKAIEAFCFLNSNGTVYDLNPLHNATKDYSSSDNKYTMHYNFCEKANTQCKEKNTTALAVLVENDNPKNCYSLGGSKSTMSKWTIESRKLKFFNILILNFFRGYCLKQNHIGTYFIPRRSLLKRPFEKLRNYIPNYLQ